LTKKQQTPKQFYLNELFLLLFMTNRIKFSEAIELIQKNIPRIKEEENIPLGHSLIGRILSRNFYSEVDCPAIETSGRDGWAVSIKSDNKIKIFEVIKNGACYAGSSKLDNLDNVIENNAIRVTTGAPLPPGSNCIIPDEWIENFNRNGRENPETIHILDKFIDILKPGKFIRPIGADVSKNEILAKKGQIVSPPLLGFLAAGGITSCFVARSPFVAVISTGDEIVRCGTLLTNSSQKYASNAACVEGALTNWHLICSNIVIAGDTAMQIATAVTDCLNNKLQIDAIITTGGVMGSERDVVLSAFSQIPEWKWTCLFHHVEMGPGKASAFGLLENSSVGRVVPVFSTPGGPQSSEAALVMFALPGLLTMCGISTYPPFLEMNLPVVIDFHLPMSKGDAWLQLVPCILNDNGVELLDSTGNRNRLSLMATKMAYVMVPPGCNHFTKGDIAHVIFPYFHHHKI
jgi:molybdopterin biosynthesis enzyme